MCKRIGRWLTSESVEAAVCNWWFVLVSVPVILWVIGNAYQS